MPVPNYTVFVCSIIFALGVAADAPLVLAANRDEIRTRESDPPGVLLSNPLLYGGRDRKARGTWLAVDPQGRICAVTNRYLPGRAMEPDASRRSRGEIAIDVLRNSDDDRAAINFLGTLEPADYNPVNVLYASRTRAFWVSLDEDGARGAELPAGIHVVTVAGADQSDAKGAWLLERARALQKDGVDSQTLLAGITELLHSEEQVGGSPFGAACIHETKYGTVSGSTVVVSPKSVTYAHAEGLPCVKPYVPVSLVSRQTRGTGLAR
jgi:uncharacterized protein with NRDE domain